MLSSVPQSAERFAIAALSQLLTMIAAKLSEGS
jgi:hypothetical protein